MPWSRVMVTASLVSCACWAWAEVSIASLMAAWSTLVLGMYFALERRPPLLAVGEGAWKKFLCDEVPVVTDKLAPTPWLLEGRLHTAIASILSELIVQPMHFRREVMTLADGGQVALDWLDAVEDEARSPGKKRVMGLVLPGLTGDSSASYLRASLKAAQQRGVTCVVFNNRGLGGVPLKTARTFCACGWEDVREVVDHIKKARPQDTLVGLGFSMGGMLLTHMAAALGEPRLDAVVTVSVPWDPHCATRSLAQGINRAFSFLLARGLRQLLLRHRPMLQGSPHFSPAMRANSVHQFDAAFTAPHFGFRDVNHYYDTATLTDKVHQIRTPLLAINAADDPFLPGHGIPVEEARKSPFVAILVTPRGGHLGFLEGMLGQSQLIGRVWDSFLAAVTQEPDVLKDIHSSQSSLLSPLGQQ